MPIETGIRMNRPGIAARRGSMAASVMPATREVTAERQFATNPWRIVARSEIQ
jgi:hypothetical protein